MLPCCARSKPMQAIIARIELERAYAAKDSSTRSSIPAEPSMPTQ